MLYKDISGRLGNQLFQYAAMRAFMERNHMTSDVMVLNFSNLGNPDFEQDLINFNVIKYEVVDKRPRLKIKQFVIIKYLRLYGYVMERVFHSDRCRYNVLMRNFCLRHAKKFMRCGVYAINQGFMCFEPPNAEILYFIGDFESALFFDDIRPIILKEFTPKLPRIKENDGLYDIINNTESVCVSIRRGDFVDNPNIKKHHYVCTPDYFMRGIQEIESRVDNPKFVVFSDDIDWVKKNMVFPDGTIFESGNDPVWEKLRLMYSCIHFIISNSTFSWWAQYLSRNPKKVVIAPKRWKNSYQNNDIYDREWILVDTDNLEGA